MEETAWKKQIDFAVTGPAGLGELLSRVEENRIRSARRLDQDSRSELGQFQTPTEIANFMASLFQPGWNELRLLDAGAGVGILTAALVNRLPEWKARPKKISVTAVEVDRALIGYLSGTFEQCRIVCEKLGVEFNTRVIEGDFIEWAARIVSEDLFAESKVSFNAAIVNPPYRKINSDSQTRLLLRQAGIETSNLYTGFVSLIVKLLERDGQLVAITPRSFCNGPYFKPFRSEFLSSMSLRRLHMFNSRAEAFRDDSVLQENIIFFANKSSKKPESVTISASSRVLSQKTERLAPYDDVVSPDDPELFIHFVTEDSQNESRRVMGRLHGRLEDLGISVSTGRVVDFRAREYLAPEPKPGTVPLIYPCHFDRGYISWPRASSKKPNAIVSSAKTRELLVPAGVYVLVKRFSAKEEPRRVVASVYDPDRVPGVHVGFENHLNYFHLQGSGLPMILAKGLAAFLNSSVVDGYFRQFNGHTQVNAMDLRSLSYPTLAQLEELGRRIGDAFPDQKELDELVEKHST